MVALQRLYTAAEAEHDCVVLCCCERTHNLPFLMKATIVTHICCRIHVNVHMDTFSMLAVVLFIHADCFGLSCGNSS